MVYLNTESHFESFYSMYTVYSQHLFHYGGAPGSPLPPAALRGACRQLLPILGTDGNYVCGPGSPPAPAVVAIGQDCEEPRLLIR